MSTVAIIGAGPLAGAVAADLAHRETCTRVLLIDDTTATVAAGKALDLLQSCPIVGSDTSLAADVRVEAASGGSVVVIADRSADGQEWQGESALSQLSRVFAATSAPVVFAGARQEWLLERSVLELSRSRRLTIGSAPLALEGAIRAVTALEADCGVADVTLTIAGRPPQSLAILWETSSIGHRPALQRLDAAAVRRIEARARALWPPGPYALAQAAAAIVAALLDGTGRTLSCFTVVEPQNTVIALPARIARGGVAALVKPESVRELTSLGL